jgi:hypothetical protein
MHDQPVLILSRHPSRFGAVWPRLPVVLHTKGQTGRSVAQVIITVTPEQ